MRAGRRATDAVVVLIWIRHIVIRDERADSNGDRDVGGDHFNHDAGDDDHGDTSIDNRLVDEYFDHDDRGSIAGYRNTRHRSVGARTRHHRVPHG